MIIPDTVAVVVANGMGFIMPNGLGLVVVDVDALILLRMQEHLFLVGFVLEAQLVEALALVGVACSIYEDNH